MEVNSQVKDVASVEVLESQIRECFGRVVYTHKTHEKCADICLMKDSRIKQLQIILSAGSLIVTLFSKDSQVGIIIGAIYSTVLLATNMYTKKYDLGKIAQKHSATANSLWNIRESYFSLLADIRCGDLDVNSIRKERDYLQKTLSGIYKGAPITDDEAYSKAYKSLKKHEEMTFSDDEIDAFLPKQLKKYS
ncbi:MAG: SLATT domain-containing protein [Nitrospirae bacterium YQR-1]